MTGTEMLTLQGSPTVSAADALRDCLTMTDAERRQHLHYLHSSTLRELAALLRQRGVA
jgi:hypothetical protein